METLKKQVQTWAKIDKARGNVDRGFRLTPFKSIFHLCIHSNLAKKCDLA